ncbi:MAG: peptidoglycan-binding protein [Clostridiales bacterium]|nr:peptidoglycan-binding protein [Clostridiales bacterium]
MEKTDIAVALYDDAACGLSPVMPYIGAGFDGKHFTRLTKLYLAAALLRCGFDVVDCNPRSVAVDAQELAVFVNRRAVDACVVISYAAFGSRRSFNDVHGFTVRMPIGRLSARSRVFCEDICAKLQMHMCGDVGNDGVFGAIGCATAVVEAGYLTYFDEAKLVYDPDFARAVAESVALGVCEHFDRPYVRMDDASCYPLLGAARRGKKVMLLQCLLNAGGSDLAIDGVFDAATDRAVKEFCIRQNKPTDRGVTADIWRELLLTERRALRFGVADNGVLYLQRKLISKLYLAPLSGVFDERTHSAINEFCAASGLSPISKENPIYPELYDAIASVGGGRPRLI